MKVLLLTLLSVVVSTLAHPDYSESFEEFKEKFGKEYESDEEEVIVDEPFPEWCFLSQLHRYGIWRSNVVFIVEHNHQVWKNIPNKKMKKW